MRALIIGTLVRFGGVALKSGSLRLVASHILNVYYSTQALQYDWEYVQPYPSNVEDVT